MYRLLTTLAIFLSFTGSVYAGAINYEINGDRIEFVITYAKPYSNFEAIRSGKNIIFSFDTSDVISFNREDFFDMPIESAYLIDDSFRKKFVVSFANSPIEPSVSKNNNRVVASFVFPTGTLDGGLDELTTQDSPTSAPAVPGMSSYVRMMFSLIIVLLIILIIYRFLRSYASKNVFTDIPGSGRLLGKVDLEVRRTLYFYEIGDTIYILSGTDNSIQLIDKITDEMEATKIKAGFVKKREFGGYMTFFSRNKSQLDDEMSITNTVMTEKIDNMRKKAGRKQDA